MRTHGKHSHPGFEPGNIQRISKDAAGSGLFVSGRPHGVQASMLMIASQLGHVDPVVYREFLRHNV